MLQPGAVVARCLWFQSSGRRDRLIVEFEAGYLRLHREILSHQTNNKDLSVFFSCVSVPYMCVQSVQVFTEARRRHGPLPHPHPAPSWS